MHTDSDPAAQLNEAVQATLFPHHPYGIPVIGWWHEIEQLERQDALAYYGRFYTPENAIHIVAGDVEPEEARGARPTNPIGEVCRRGAPPVRFRPQEPDQAPPGGDAGGRQVEQPSRQRAISRPPTAGGPGRGRSPRGARPSLRRRPNELPLPRRPS